MIADKKLEKYQAKGYFSFKLTMDKLVQLGKRTIPIHQKESQD